MSINVANIKYTGYETEIKPSNPDRKTRREDCKYSNSYDADDCDIFPHNSETAPYKNPEATLNAQLVRQALIAKRTGAPVEVIASDIRAKVLKDKTINLLNNIKYRVDNLKKLYEGSEAPNTVITYDLKDNKKTEICFKDGKLESYKEGYEKFENGESADKYLQSTSDGFMYYENYEEYNNGASSASKSIIFEDDKMTAYYENMRDIEIGLHLRYDKNGQMYEYAEDIIAGEVTGKHYILENGKWVDITRSAAS